MTLYGAIDLGSHSAKLLLARRDDTGRWRRVRERVTITALGAGNPARDGLDPRAADRTVSALADFAALGREAGVADVAVAATAVLRQARDAARFVARVAAETGFTVEIVGGDDEARLTYRGARAQLPKVGGAVITCDVGGRSTEFAWGRDASPAGLASLDLGTITLTDDHGLGTAVSTPRLARARAAARRRLDAVAPDPPPERIVAVGATPGTLVALMARREVADSLAVHAAALPAAQVMEQVERLRRLDEARRGDLPGLHPGRARVILAGAVIMEAVARRWPDAPVVVSAAGLREGLLTERFPPPDLARSPRLA